MSETQSEPELTHAEYVLIGGGLCSATAAKSIREQDPDGRIVIVSAEKQFPYHRPPLSKEYLRGDADFSEAQIAGKDDYAAQKIEIWLGVRALKLNTETKTVTLDNGQSLTFEKLCIATGASAKPLDPDKIPGADAYNVLTLRTVGDSDVLRNHLTAGARAVVIGAGYIGMEVAAVCRQKGLEVTVIDSHDHPWSKNTSPSFGKFLQRYYETQGVRFLMQDGVREINKDSSGNAVSVLAKSGVTLPCDLVVAGVGAKLNLELLEDAGLKSDPKEGAAVDEFLQTEVDGIYAAGDIACFRDPVLGKSWHVEHWQNAEWHGQIAGKNMAAKTAADRVAYDHIPYFFSDEFDLHMTLRGDPQAGESSFSIGSMEPETEGFLELYVREDGTLAMGLLISKKEDESATADLLERL
ncbi:MAG: FAD/NAD(P)-binding oxidoreductase, partial [Armatimonadota bacterium]